ncbi:MAG: hypothetical protein LBF84_00715 [Holosporales bacterium]|jgi:chromosomal replication initiation ATPase DnaA|nr:hypothetical protein [Holosporales bacterium]
MKDGRQLLPLIDKVDYSPEKWVQAPCNAMVTRWLSAVAGGGVRSCSRGSDGGSGTWRITCVCGPRESGKTHIASMFKQVTHAATLTPDACGIQPSEILADRKVNAFVLDNIEYFEEEWLFNVFNLLVNKSAIALFTVGSFVPQWNFHLKDLESRLKSTNIINIYPPDDDLIKNIITKQCQDNGIYIDASTTDFLIKRIPRRFEDINYWVRKLNKYSLISGAKISKTLVMQLLADEESVEPLC